jgi:hypothetical protein
MYDVVVGLVRLDVWKDGRGVVSWVGEGSGRSRIPADPEAFNFSPIFGRTGVGLLVASAVTCGGAAQLYRTGSGVIAVAVVVVALALAGFGAMFLFGGLFPRIRGSYVTLTGPVVEEFRAIAEAERSSLGDDPHKEEYKLAAERLWVLAQDLAAGDGMNE